MLLNLPKQRKEMIKEMMEEAMELVETNQKSISGVRFEILKKNFSEIYKSRSEI